MGVTCAAQHWMEGSVGVSHPWMVARRPRSHFDNILPWLCQFFSFPHSVDERPMGKLHGVHLTIKKQLSSSQHCAAVPPSNSRTFSIHQAQIFS